MNCKDVKVGMFYISETMVFYFCKTNLITPFAFLTECDDSLPAIQW